MLFNSLEFVAFLVVVLAVYVAIPRRRWTARKSFLVLASWIFYASWNPAFLLLLAASTAGTFALGLAIAGARGARARRALFVLTVTANLALLAVFKYGRFLAESGLALLRPLVGDLAVPLTDVALPIGISFYTFESLAYAIDVYRGLAPTRSLLDFALFLSFFPHLVAGPIVRPGAFLPQLAAPPTVTEPALEDGVARIAGGLAKKILLADVIGRWVDGIYAHVPGAGAGTVLLAIYAYAFQIYLDFSAYTDIAIGLAALFGLRLPENFARPYLATGPRDFWRRWHVSLSTWLRDYLYFPLGGNRRGRGRTMVNLMITMVLGGLWHGAAWHYVAWGAYHGALLVGEHALGPRIGVGPAWLRRFVTFNLMAAGFVIFRAPSLADVAAVAAGLVRGPLALPPGALGTAALVVVAAALHVAPSATRARAAFARLPPALQGAAYAMLAAGLFLSSPATQGFIYFQF